MVLGFWAFVSLLHSWAACKVPGLEFRASTTPPPPAPTPAAARTTSTAATSPPTAVVTAHKCRPDSSAEGRRSMHDLRRAGPKGSVMC